MKTLIEVHFTCPFCGRPAIAFAAETYGVAHNLPECSRFKSLDAYTFLKAANKKLAESGLMPVSGIVS